MQKQEWRIKRREGKINWRKKIYWNESYRYRAALWGIYAFVKPRHPHWLNVQLSQPIGGMRFGIVLVSKEIQPFFMHLPYQLISHPLWLSHFLLTFSYSSQVYNFLFFGFITYGILLWCKEITDKVSITSAFHLSIIDWLTWAFRYGFP